MAPKLDLEPLKLSNLTYNITNRCNLRCPWCYNDTNVGDEIPVRVITDWIGAARSLPDDFAFIILGGEPFLDESRLIECVEGARTHFDGEILVSTNGTILSDATPHALRAAGVTVQVSIDGADGGRHDAMRGHGVFDRAVRTAGTLLDAGVHVVLSMVLTEHAPDEIEPYFELAERIGADEVRFIPMRRIGRGAELSEPGTDLEGCFHKLIDVLDRRPEYVRLLKRDFFSILMTVCKFSRLRADCGIARRCLFVDADGGLYPCPNHRSPEHRCCDVRTLAFDQVLSTSPTLAAMRERYGVEHSSKCGTCAFRFWCAGDCRAEAISVLGSPNVPSPNCRAIRRIIPQLFWLIADGRTALGQHEKTSGWLM